MIPKDPMMLLSYVNTQLRDHYTSLDELSEGLDVSIEDIVLPLEAIGYQYDQQTNRFMKK